MMLMRALTIAVGFAAAALPCGCASSPWQSAFKPSDAAAPALLASEPVRIREVPWERLDAALQELQRQIVASDTHPDDWDQPRKDAAKARLLRALQVSEDPARVDILGRSEFRTTDAVRPADGSLASFARTRGADTVIFARTFTGRINVVRQESINEFRSGSVYFRDRDDRRRSDTFTESATIWIPVARTEDQFAFVAYFLRTRD